MPRHTHKKIHSILVGTLPPILRLETGKLHQPKKKVQSTGKPQTTAENHTNCS